MCCFLLPVCYMLPSFSCHVGMLSSELCDISMLATPQKSWPFNLYIIWLPSMTVSLCFCFSNQTRLKSDLFFHRGKVVTYHLYAPYSSLSYLVMIKCFLSATNTIIAQKFNIILCITGNLRRKLLEPIRPRLENTITKVIFDFL